MAMTNLTDIDDFDDLQVEDLYDPEYDYFPDEPYDYFDDISFLDERGEL